jgi:hypothetical protein
MMRDRVHLCLLILVTVAVGTVNPSRGEEPTGPVKITLYPSAASVPALEYRLLPGRLEQRSGNAAVHYGKVTAEETSFFGKREMRDKIDEMLESPLDQLRRDDVRMPGGGPDGSIQDDVRRGAHCRYCDWDFPIGDVPFYTMLLPDAQQTRQFARVLAAQARIQIARGEFADAVDSFKAGFALGQHVAAGETLVSGLIGIAISESMTRQVREFIQQPGAPNLYWALTMLPRPLIDMRDALDVEAAAVELSFPELRDTRTTKRTPDEWKAQFHHFAHDVISQTSSNESPPPPSPNELDARVQQMLPTARQALIASGLPGAEVEAMAPYQAALLYTLAIFREQADSVIKYFYLPYPEANAGIESVIEHAKQDQPEIIPIAERLFPAIRVCRSAVARIDRQIAVLRVLEALRIYGARHNGQLPKRLEDVTAVPIPNDPVTGLPFVYLFNGEKALLQGPTLRNDPLNYEITMSSLK